MEFPEFIDTDLMSITDKHFNSLDKERQAEFIEHFPRFLLREKTLNQFETIDSESIKQQEQGRFDSLMASLDDFLDEFYMVCKCLLNSRGTKRDLGR
jgi:hypothetical protein